MQMKIDPIFEPFLQDGKTLILDGGLATELEHRGFDLNDPLWSGKILLENPDVIRQVHLDYLYAGADCIITATYQTTFQGLKARGLTQTESAELMRLAVRLALEARDEFWSVKTNHTNRERPLVAASVGPYGAYLADGSEYRGDYGLTVDELADFHRPRWNLLAQTDADFLLCETVPSLLEAQAYHQLVTESAEGQSMVKAALCFTFNNSQSISDQTKLSNIQSLLFDYANFVGVGVNCTPPQYLPEIINQFQEQTSLPIIAYPNSGETWDAQAHCWHGTTHPEEFGTAVREWRRMGAALIGGCCRTGPKHIRAISERLRK